VYFVAEKVNVPDPVPCEFAVSVPMAVCVHPGGAESKYTV